ncbi:MAG: DNA polymerase III subunit gamma/tau, partial [Burkholderiaceae bacterium]
MEPYVVSALKYRPQHFNDVVGQQAITKTLENAIAKQQLPQALLFCGPRGVGKTTCARILAKKINILEGVDIQEQDFAFNIFELDAASNNSVNDIRNLNDQVRIPPQVGSHKVYIIDEVHMLSTGAFNAFLKTLEEPPKHVIFILATTEKHKIIPTILSRCQIFEFKRITPKDIQQYLATIAQTQAVTFEEEALFLIGQKADGAMRDALSIFDRMCSFCDNNLTVAAVSENLNILDYSSYLSLSQKLIDHNIPEALLQYNSIVIKGFDGLEFISGLAAHLRTLFLCKDPQTTALLEVGEQIQNKYKGQAEKITITWLIDAMELANKCELNYKISQHKRLHVVLCLMQIASLLFNGEKKKGVLIPTSFFLKQGPPKLSTKKSQAQTPKIIKESTIENHSLTQNKNPSVNKEVLPKIELNSPLSKNISSFSLQSIHKKKAWSKQQNKSKLDNVQLHDTAFNQLDLEVYWEKYYQKKIEQKEQNLASLFQLNKPHLQGDKTIIYEVPSTLNKVEMEREFEYFLPYLREKLNHFNIQIKIVVKQSSERKFIYT